eukprot:TRINITY_DN5238_c0_g1_i1.p1 TRINITY_DN5238_c0_g1~~TRINITY_DN5238_c0_g1_i1.p1  ORF type:complete len:322 (+),score=30.87 TRINITY_DN5238_c0_g1_i1:587-1552(+)
MGGLGLRSSSAHSTAAFVASVHATAPLVGVLCKNKYNPLAERHLLDATKTLLDRGLQLNADSDYTQKALSHQIDKIAREQLLQKLTDRRDLVRLHGIGCKHAHAWLTALPTAELKIDNFLFKLLIHIWLGLPILQDDNTRCSRCGDPLDRFAHHALLCKCGGDRTARHNRVRSIVYWMAKDALLSPVLEAKHLSSGKLRPADVLLAFSDREKIPVDVTIVSPFAKQILNAKPEPLTAATTAERRKHQKYHDVKNFSAFAIESTGGLGQEASALMDRILKRVAERTNKPLSVISTHYHRLLSVTLQRSIAYAVSMRLPPPHH